MNGFLLVDKPIDWTSRDVCNKIQHLFHTKKVGHTGTLDPFATGLLMVTIGSGTKAGTFMENKDKEYLAELVLGIETSTGDLTGDIVSRKDVPEIDLKLLTKSALEIIGPQKQIPPMTSAIHVNGQKLYELAHKGIEIDRPARDIEVFSFEIISLENNILTFKTRVSKGTYIRTLGEDFAKKLGTVGHLKSLRRTMIGDTDLSLAKRLEELKEDDVISIYDVLSKNYQTIECDEQESIKVKNGSSLKIDSKEDFLFIVSKDKKPLAIYEKVGAVYKCKRGLWS